jgi:CHAT domain-containing protein
MLRLGLSPRLAAVIIMMLAGCTTSTPRQPEAVAPRPVTDSVVRLYNAGAAAFNSGTLQEARENHEAALKEARSVSDIAGIGLSLAALGDVARASRQYRDAIKLYSDALPYLKRANQRRAEAFTLAVLGEVQGKQGLDTDAITSLTQALALGAPIISEASPDERGRMLDIRASVLSQRAGAYERRRLYAEAKDDYQRAAEDLQAVGKPGLAGRALLSAADFARLKLGAPEEAGALYARASVLLQEAGEPLDATRARAGVGWSQIAAGRSDSASETFGGVVEEGERLSAPDVAATGYLGRALSRENRGGFHDALTDYQKGLERLRDAGDKGSYGVEGDVLLAMGALFRVLGQHERAIEQFRSASVRYRRAARPDGEANALTRLAEMSLWVGDYRNAIGQYQQALSLYEVAQDLPKQVEVLAALTEATWANGAPIDDSMQYWNKGWRLIDEHGKQSGLDIQKIVAEARERAKPTQAELDTFVKQARPTTAPEYLPASTLLYSLFTASPRAADFMRKAAPSLSIEYVRAVGSLYQKAGRIALESGRPDLAQGLLGVATAFHTSLPLSRDLLIEVGKDFFFGAEAQRRLRNPDQALLLFRVAALAGGLLKTPELHWVNAGLGRTYADIGDVPNALAHYRLAIEEFESIQSEANVEDIRTDVLASAMYAYRSLPHLLLDAYRRAGDRSLLYEAFQYSERLRARSFLALFRRSTMLGTGGEIGAILAREEPLQRRVSEIHRNLRAPKLGAADEGRLVDELERLRADWRAMRENTARQNVRYGLIADGHSADVTDVQAALAGHEAFLEYVLAPDRSTLWVITNTEVEAFDLPGRDALPILDEFVKTLRSPLVGSDEKARHVTLGRQLYGELIARAQHLLQGKSSLIVAPDGPLYYLPFEALVLPKRQTTDATQAESTEPRYLLERFSVTYVPSGSIFVALRQQRGRRVTAPLPLAAFGDPIYPQRPTDEVVSAEPRSLRSAVLRGATLNRLPFSGDEVHKVATVFGVPMNSPHVNLRENATVDRMREMDLSRYRILHFAVHAVLADEVTWATQPALVLSPSAHDHVGGGLLQMADVLGLKLNADLVVLSACNTGLGQLREGEGIVGLTRAFFYAGAASVMVSLWPVEDQATSLLMTRFYERLKQGEAKAEALRQAKRDVLRTTVELQALGTPERLAAPFYWAGFVLVGD